MEQYDETEHELIDNPGGSQEDTESERSEGHATLKSCEVRNTSLSHTEPATGPSDQQKTNDAGALATDAKTVDNIRSNVMLPGEIRVQSEHSVGKYSKMWMSSDLCEQSRWTEADRGRPEANREVSGGSTVAGTDHTPYYCTCCVNAVVSQDHRRTCSPRSKPALPFRSVRTVC